MLNANQVVVRSGGMIGDLTTLMASGGVLVAIVEIYYLARHKVDFLLGTIGIQTIAEDRFELATFWVIFGLFCLALATGRMVRTALALLAIYTLYSLHGVAYSLTSTPTIDPTTLPTVSDGGNVKAYDQSQRVLKCTSSDCNEYSSTAKQTPVSIRTTDPNKWEEWGNEKGYTKDFKLTGDKSDQTSTLGWCYAENPKTGKINLYNSEHSTLNCITGWRWKPPVNGS